MCCFSGRVEKVADTKIFARASEKGRQFLVYSMKFKADEAVAMILPLPVPEKTKEDAVKFINLEKYEEFFSDLRDGFPIPPSDEPAPDSRDVPRPAAEPPLKVETVGSFEASFVPTVKDFARLDKRFRLPDDVWEKLGGYAKYGFAVFKLKAGDQKVHPMAFEFPRADDTKLFFPTVHIHDGKVHDKASFDHLLYCQIAEGQSLPMFAWEESPSHAVNFMKIDKTAGIVEKDAHVYLRRMYGKLKNEDVLV
jgi:hypothetical protein